jgi:hypothetical protein
VYSDAIFLGDFYRFGGRFANGMKRELELGDSPGGGTRAETTQESSSCVEVSENSSSDRKRFKGSVVKGLIVYTRERKSRFNWSNGISENGHDKPVRSSDEQEINGNASQVVVRDGPNCNLGMPICREGQESELVQCPTKEGGVEGNFALVSAESSEGKNDFPKEEVWGFTPLSAVRPKVEPTMESVVNSSEAAQNESYLNLDGEATGGVSASKTPKNNLELKMSKKIALNKKPMTVKELFETGFLDGVTVVYMGTNQVDIV